MSLPTLRTTFRRGLVLLALFGLTGAAIAQPVQPTDGRRQTNTRQTQPDERQPTGDARMDEIRAMLREGAFDRAAPQVEALARQGHPEAQFFLALMHSRGDGVRQDFREAVRWYTHSALQGWSDSIFNLGQMYYRGDGVDRNPQLAADLFLLNAVTGDADGQWAFGVCLIGGEGRPQDPIEGGAWLMIAVEQDHELAREELDKLQRTMSNDDWETSRSTAQMLYDMIRQDGFDPAKLPRVPVPAFMADEADPRTPERRDDQQQAGPEGHIPVRITLQAAFNEVGDMHGNAVIHWPPEVFSQLREAAPDPSYFLRDLSSGRAEHELAPDASARYDEQTSTVVMDLHMLGSAENLGDGEWRWEPDDHQFVEIDMRASGPVVIFNYEEIDEDAGMHITGRAEYTLPDGATDVTWRAHREELTYRLPYDPPAGRARLDVDFRTRDRLMSCLYKVYGLETEFPAMWVAKAVCRNTGDGVIRDLRVRFRLGGYSEWSPWRKFPELLPGQTTVAVYKPVLDRRIAELTSTTPANVYVEWRYEDADGEREEDSDGDRISILGRHEFIFSNLKPEDSMGSYYDLFSNAHFVAAWVTRDDPVVKQFAAMANKAAGGAGAPYSDEAAMTVLRSCYEIMQANNFTYQGPVGFHDENMSFDNTIVQSIKFPRDVIRDKSGTCIELAALYCAMVHSIGLEPALVLVPGHAFPIVKLPSGDYVPVETTGVGGGKKFGTASFDQVVNAAVETYQKWLNEGLVIQVNIRDYWSRGVSSPELEPLPADILERWKIVINDMEHGPGPGPEPEGNIRQFAGQWSGQASSPMPDGSQVTWPMVLEIGPGQAGSVVAEFYGELEVREYYSTTKYQVSESFEGQLRGAELIMRGTQKTVTINGVRQPMATDSMTVSLQGQTLVGRVQLAEGGSMTFQARRQ
jgi:hypothetical protein